MKKIIFSIALLLIVHIALGQNKKDTASPFILGTIEIIKSVALSENRTLNIYLPEGYNPKDSLKYPVVYLLDGSADEDFIQIVGLYHYNSFPWINRVPKSIIVGIANVDRKRDFTYPTTIKSDQKTYATSGHSANFITFIEKELQPYIEKRYHTNSSRTIIGQSLGGLVATEILLKKPKLFNSYIIISPSLWWDNGSLFGLHGDIMDKGFTGETKIYIGVGREGLAPAEIPHVMEVDANLLAEKIRGTKSENLKVYFDYLPNEDHATVTHQAVFNALRLLNPKQGELK